MQYCYASVDPYYFVLPQRVKSRMWPQYAESDVKATKLGGFSE